MKETGRPDLDAIVRYAGERSAYYRDLLEGVARFDEIPPLTKPVAQANFDRILVPGLPDERLIRGWTSGTTGQPTAYVLDAHAAPAAEAARAWLLGLAGLPGDVHIVLTLNDPVLPPTLKGWTAFRMWDTTRANLEERLAALAGLGDYILYGQAALLEWMAAELERAAGPLPMPRPLAVVTSSDLLTASGRPRIERAFRCPAHSWYGSRETDPSLAGTPPGEHGRYLINEHRAYLEVADERGRPCPPGERGRVLVTDLHNRCFPLLRYDVGDLAVMSDRSSGGGTMIERLEGRQSAIVELPNGTQLTEVGVGFAVLRAGNAAERIDGVQCVQTGANALELRVVWSDGRDKDAVELLRASGRRLWGEDAEIGVRDVERLETLPSGKRWLLRGLPG